MDVDRFVEPIDLVRNELGGDVVATELGTYGWCLNVYDMTCVPGDMGWMDIHMSWSWFGQVPPGLQEAIVGWSRTADGGASLAFELPPGSRDVSAYDYFGFRTVPNPGYSANWGVEFQDLVVALRDEDGNEARVGASDIGNEALASPSRAGAGGSVTSS